MVLETLILILFKLFFAAYHMWCVFERFYYIYTMVQERIYNVGHLIDFLSRFSNYLILSLKSIFFFGRGLKSEFSKVE